MSRLLEEPFFVNQTSLIRKYVIIDTNVDMEHKAKVQYGNYRLMEVVGEDMSENKVMMDVVSI